MECKNCNKSQNIEDKFCSNCGQKNISKLNMKFVFGEVFQTLFNLDSKVFRSLRFLIFKPGFLTKEYVEGRRVSYLPPIRIYIVLSFIFFFSISVFDVNENSTSNFSVSIPKADQNNLSITNNKDSVPDGVKFTIGGENVIIPTSELKRMQYDGTLDKGLDSLTAEMPKFAGYVSRKMALTKLDDKGFMDVLRDQFSLFLILFLPFFALLYATIFSQSKKGFVGHLIFNLHLNSLVLFVLLSDLLIGSIIGSNDIINLVWIAFMIVYVLTYLIKAVMVFYQRKLWVALYKLFLLLFGYSVLALVFMIAVLFSSIIML